MNTKAVFRRAKSSREWEAVGSCSLLLNPCVKGKECHYYTVKKKDRQIQIFRLRGTKTVSLCSKCLEYSKDETEVYETIRAEFNSDTDSSFSSEDDSESSASSSSGSESDSKSDTSSSKKRSRTRSKSKSESGSDSDSKSDDSKSDPESDHQDQPSKKIKKSLSDDEAIDVD